MEVVAESVGGYYEEDLEFLAVAFVDSPVAGFDAVGFEFVSGALGVGNSDGGTVLSWVAAVDCEADAGAVAFHDDGRDGFGVAFYFGETKGFGVVFGGGDDVFDGQGQDIIAKGYAASKSLIA